MKRHWKDLKKTAKEFKSSNKETCLVIMCMSKSSKTRPEPQIKCFGSSKMNRFMENEEVLRMFHEACNKSSEVEKLKDESPHDLNYKTLGQEQQGAVNGKKPKRKNKKRGSNSSSRKDRHLTDGEKCLPPQPSPENKSTDEVTTATTNSRLDSNKKEPWKDVALMHLSNIEPWNGKAAATCQMTRNTKAPTKPSTSNGPATYSGLPVRSDRKIIDYIPDSVLGHGSCGTIVSMGFFDKRVIAVKRLLKENFDFAYREIGSLRQSDQHPNIIRYYYNEENEHTINIALELCQGTLKDNLGNIKLNPIEIIHQTMKGLAHLHSLGIGHMNIKPDNILISRPSVQGVVRVIISGFGRSRMLPSGEMSISSKSDVYGTEGWATPEMSITGQKITCAVDIFSAGRLLHYVLTGGKYPVRDQKGNFKLDELPKTSDGYLAEDIIQDMLSSNPEARPTATDVLQHPLFWNKDKKLQLLVISSDRISVRKGRKKVHGLENNRDRIFEHDWIKPLSPELKDVLENDKRDFKRDYSTSTVKDLLRLIRNKRHHYDELDENVQKLLGSVPDEYLEFFTSRFPLLLVHIYQVMKQCSKEDAFKAFY